MECKRCLKDVTQYGPFGYCPQCEIWYIADGEEIEGVYMYCVTKESSPEKCDPFILELNMKMGEVPEGGKIPIAPTSLTNVRKADKICADCENKHFVLKF